MSRSTPKLSSKGPTDQFAPAPTFRKTSADAAKVIARKAVSIYESIYEDYAKAAKVPVSENLKSLVDDFRNGLEISPKQRVNKDIKQKWLTYYNTHK
jgi:hypothetical protein